MNNIYNNQVDTPSYSNEIGGVAGFVKIISSLLYVSMKITKYNKTKTKEQHVNG